MSIIKHAFLKGKGENICISLILLLPSTASGLFSSPTIKQDNVINGHFSHFESVVDHPMRVHNLIECNIKCAVCKMKTDKGPTPPTITFPGNRYQPPSLCRLRAFSLSGTWPATAQNSPLPERNLDKSWQFLARVAIV